MAASLGLSTYRWNNNIKSMLLLLAFPILLLALAWFLFLVVAFAGRESTGIINPSLLLSLNLRTIDPTAGPAEFAWAGVVEYWPTVLGIAAVWVSIGYLFNGAIIHMATGARSVTREEAPRLYNLVENLCISRGLAVPQLYVIDTDAMNAYASGISKRNYAITVTRGLLDTLNDAELEAVLGHELTHIINRDVRLLIVTVVFVGMISFLAQLLWSVLRYTRFTRVSRGRNGLAAGLVLLAAAFVLAIGYFFALILRFAISRKREYLADAGSVELTKNPEALISALRKISENADVPHVPPDVKQMFIENPPTAMDFFGLFATHPPIEARIRVLGQLAGVPPREKSIIPSTNS